MIWMGSEGITDSIHTGEDAHGEEELNISVAILAIIDIMLATDQAAMP